MKVKEKKVELIELFYDLIYVYAIAKLTALIGEPVDGGIPFSNLFSYIVTSFVILQAWLYFTNYVNRYGKWTWYDYLIACINMIAVIYMSNTISTNWNQMATTFNIAMLIMLLTVLALYGIQAYKEKTMKNAAGNSIINLTIVSFVYLIAIVCILFGINEAIIWIDVVAVFLGAFLPFFIRGHFDKSIISFPHLVERFELLAIITFDEVIVGMAHFFDVNSFNVIPILVFGIVITMFGAYVIQIHYLMEHHREERSLRLMFSHYFIVISINLITVAFELIHSGEINHWVVSAVVIISLIMFYTSIMANSKYYKENVKKSKKELIEMSIITALGSAIILMFIDSFYGFLIGTLVITSGNFIVLMNKYRKLFSYGKEVTERNGIVGE